MIQYISIFKRTLWNQRKLAYVELRKRLRENGGKMGDRFHPEVEEILIHSSNEVRAHVCEKAELIKSEDEDYYTILQECYLKNVNNPEFTNNLNEIRNEHVFLLGRILAGELIPEIEHLDIDNTDDGDLDELNKKFMKSLGK